MAKLPARGLGVLTWDSLGRWKWINNKGKQIILSLIIHSYISGQANPSILWFLWCLFCSLLLSIVDIYSVTSFFFWDFKVHILMQSESLTRTDSTIRYITMSTLRNQANYFKIILYDLQGFFPIGLHFLCPNMVPEGWNHDLESFPWSLSYSILSPFNLPLTPPHSPQKLFPFGVSFPSICSS